jgi:hypothetical protein
LGLFVLKELTRTLFIESDVATVPSQIKKMAERFGVTEVPLFISLAQNPVKRAWELPLDDTAIKNV